MRKASILAIFCLLAACKTTTGSGLEQPQAYVPPELGPGNAWFTFVPSPARQHTFASRANYAHPELSGDGTSLVYAATLNGKHSDIFVQNVEARSTQEIAPHPMDDITPCFNPDATRIAFASNRDGHWNIYIAGMHAAEPVVQVTDDSWESFAPTFSPDGRYLAYSTRRVKSEPWQIALADLKSGSRTILCEGVYPDFSPTGELIAFTRNSRMKPGWPSIWTVTIDGSQRSEVYRSDEHGAITPSFAGPDWILFSTIGRMDGNEKDGQFKADDIWVVNVNGTQAARATWHGMQDWDPVFDPHTDRCYYISNRDGVQNIYSSSMRVPKLIADDEMVFGAGGK
ncbi:MAG: hypothetical protein L3J82_06365 [Planctomycetes bacterium]|nr:hypothetical protein [Planctomycetota bacterium]